jgi:hypothetical protein
VSKAESVNVNCACHGAARSATRFASGVIVTTFNNQHQALQTQITELEVALATAIEAKRAADLLV